MAKNAIRGLIPSFRRAKRVQHTHETIAEIGEETERATLVGAKALWTGEGGLRVVGRIPASPRRAEPAAARGPRPPPREPAAAGGCGDLNERGRQRIWARGLPPDRSGLR